MGLVASDGARGIASVVEDVASTTGRSRTVAVVDVVDIAVATTSSVAVAFWMTSLLVGFSTGRGVKTHTDTDMHAPHTQDIHTHHTLSTQPAEGWLVGNLL